MISKKNKALVAGVLAAASAVSAVLPVMGSAAENTYATENKANESYASMFASLYDDVITNGQTNGYLSKNTNGSSFGIPYHSVETLCIEAPDYGHETTSEAMSYIVWVAAMHDALVANNKISGSSDIQKAWKTLEAIIPGWSEASGRNNDVLYETFWTQNQIQSDVARELDTPQEYPTKATGSKTTNPLWSTFKTAYGGDKGYYLMHWLADVDDWYGFSGGNGKFTFINTFQRGEQESCFETVPHPCLEELQYGNKDGIKGIFNGPNVAAQYAFTNAPDAEDRAIQAIFFGNHWGVNAGEVSALAGKMGDQCRNDMFDKYYLEIGCQNIDSTPSSAKSQHYLMGWYTSWGGALGKSKSDYTWAWQIGCSHSHQFYQNPLAAYALLTDTNMQQGIADKSGDKKDYEESLKRQIEMYLWLQSREGPFAGGCTNSFRGRYEKYPSGYPTFYDMVYTPHPVYADPGSNHWIGNQVWSTQRLAELYYYLCTEGDNSGVKVCNGTMTLKEALEAVLERWIDWFEKNTIIEDTDPDGNYWDYAIPSTLDWGSSDTDYSVAPDTWNGKYDPDGNQKLHCVIKGYGKGDVGCVSSLCNTLIYYAKAKGVAASESQDSTAKDDSIAAKGLRLANRLLTKQWNEGRDEIGISFLDHNGSLNRVFEQWVYIPKDYTGTMPDGSKLQYSDENAPLESRTTFASIRTKYQKDKMYQDLEKVWKENNGKTEKYEYKLHRFWHAGDALMSYGGMALLYPEVEPFKDGPGPQPHVDGIWGDANMSGEVKMNDAVLIMQSVSNSDEYGIGGTDKNALTSDGAYWGDVYQHNGGDITNMDAVQIQKFLIHTIASLDPTK